METSASTSKIEPRVPFLLVSSVSAENVLTEKWRHPYFFFYGFLLSIFALFMIRKFAYFFEILVGHTMKKKR